MSDLKLESPSTSPRHGEHLANTNQDAPSQLSSQIGATITEKWKARIAKWLTSAVMIFMLVQFLVIGICALIFQWALLQSDVVLKVIPAGTVITATQSTGLFSRGSVETDSSFYFLDDPLSVKKAAPVTLEYRGDHSRRLCDSEHHCARLQSSFL